MVFDILQGKIVLFIFTEIQSPGLCGDTSERVVAELPAAIAHRHDSLLGTEHHILVHFRAEPAVEAGAVHFFTKQHVDPFLSRPLYTIEPGISSAIFIKRKAGINKKEIAPICR